MTHKDWMLKHQKEKEHQKKADKVNKGLDCAYYTPTPVQYNTFART